MEQRYSRAVAIGNHVVWTPDEVLPVPFVLDGLMFDGAECAVFRVPGRDMLAKGFQVDFRVPAQSHEVRVGVWMYTGHNIPVTNGRLLISGIRSSSLLLFSPDYPMPTNSVWKFVIDVENGDPLYLPQGITITYLLRYSEGPVGNPEAVYDLQETGIGFWKAGENFVVQ